MLNVPINSIYLHAHICKKQIMYFDSCGFPQLINPVIWSIAIILSLSTSISMQKDP